MVSYEHTQTAKLIREIDAKPTDPEGHSSWVSAEKHLQLLRDNAGDGEVILYAFSRPYFFILGVMAPGQDIYPPDFDDLVKWSATPYTDRACYSWSKGTSDIRAEPLYDPPSRKSLTRSQNLVFARQLEQTDYPATYELLQEFVHTSGIFWLDEHHAYCKVDENGDIEPVVSITSEQGDNGFVLITCKRRPLERYLAATGNVLVRLFDFMMIKDNFSSWHDSVRETIAESDFLFYDQCLHPDGHGFTRGTQLLPVTLTRDDLFGGLIDPGAMRSGGEYARFIVQDFRNDNRVVEVSAAPGETVNYFNMQGSSLPHELSPVFFRPEVLARYKADRDKYTVDEEHRVIRCRGAWELRSYDINDAGQVHAYLCDLRHLPYQEQRYWRIHNEEPKGTISLRSIENDFQGTWASYETPLDRVMRTVRGWARHKREWWKIDDEDELYRVNTPVSNSKDEWGGAFVELSKAVIEGFQISPIRALLRQKQISFKADERSLSLIRKLLSTQTSQDGGHQRLEGLQEVQKIRSKVQSHRSGSEADQMAKSAIAQHGTYRGHFEHVCNQVADELELIEQDLELAHQSC